MIKTRIEEESNYRSVYCNGKTLRFALDTKLPIKELIYPEFYDVDIFGVGQGLCKGKCPYCYLSVNEDGKYVEDAVEKITKYFGDMTINQRPYQVAMPGSGEFTMHPDHVNILKAFHDLGIQPNYTTNGMWVDESKELIENLLIATQLYCGGVAVSCHSHLKKYWTKAAKIYSDLGVKLFFHFIISDRRSIDEFSKIYVEWKDLVDYFVLLPYREQGRAKHKEIDWEYLVEKMPVEQTKLAFGAHFYPYLMETKHNFKVSIYEPEICSKFLDLKGHGSLYKISFNLEESIKTNLF